MPLFRVRYAGPQELEIEAEEEFDAEIQAADETGGSWIAEEIEGEDNG